MEEEKHSRDLFASNSVGVAQTDQKQNSKEETIDKGRSHFIEENEYKSITYNEVESKSVPESELARSNLKNKDLAPFLFNPPSNKSALLLTTAPRRPPLSNIKLSSNRPLSNSSISDKLVDAISFSTINDIMKRPTFISLNRTTAVPLPASVPLSPSSTPQKLLTMPHTIRKEIKNKSNEDDTEDINSESMVLVSPDDNLSPKLTNVPSSASILTLNKVSKDSIRSDRPLSLCGSLADFLNRIRLGNRKIRRRAIFKNGDCNIIQSKPAKDRIRFLQDFFTTLVDTQWRWTLICFALSFFASWLIFALIWWLIAFTHGDLEPDHLPDKQGETGWTPCVVNIWGFTSCYLFSIETQHTIGYGGRATTEECPEAVFIESMQSIIGVIIQALMVGIVFAKMSRPKHRTQTLLFSKNAVVYQRDNHLCLMFRVGDMAKSHIIGASIKARLIRSKTTCEGEVLNYFQEELEISADGCAGDLFFIWPMTIVHAINENSPLYHLTASDMLQERFEIVVILEGTIESTGQSTQARSSYINNEILWGHRFEQIVTYNKEKQGYEVDLSKFNNTVPVDTPLCSAVDLEEFYKSQKRGVQSYKYCPPLSKQTQLMRFLFPTTPPYSPDSGMFVEDQVYRGFKRQFSCEQENASCIGSTKKNEGEENAERNTEQEEELPQRNCSHA